MPRKPELPTSEKRTQRITILTTETVKQNIEAAASADRRPLSAFCENILINAIKK